MEMFGDFLRFIKSGFVVFPEKKRIQFRKTLLLKT